MKIPAEIVTRIHNERLDRDLRSHIKQHGWYNTAKVLRELVSVHVGWDSEFTELDNVLRRIEGTFSGEIRKITDIDRAANDHTEDKLDIGDYYRDPPDGSLHPPDQLPDGNPSDHFS